MQDVALPRRELLMAPLLAALVPGAARCVPVPAGGFVHRLAHTPHYDGVVASGGEPAIIAICGMAPVDTTYEEPEWRKAG